MIYRYDFRYTLAKMVIKIGLKANFKKMIFIGRKENVSKNRAIIFAANHRNALLDALILVYASYHRKQIVFLARADIFKKKLIAWMLRGMRIMPVYRIRDGIDNLGKNNEIFANAAKILRKKNTIGLFPEAKHNPKQSLLPIQKAAPRIILPTEASVNFQLQSQIIPIAIYYRDISALLSDVYVTFGSPIEVSKYKDIYNENPVHAVNQLRSELEERLKAMVVNIQNDEYYDEYCHAIDWNGDSIAKKQFADRKDDFLQAALYIVKKLNGLLEENREAFEYKMNDFREAFKILNAHGLRTKDRLQSPSSGLNILSRFVALAISAPVALFGFLNAIFPILINKKLLGMFKDKQFIASVRYACGIVFVPIFDLLQTLVIGFSTRNWSLALVYFFLMPLTFYFTLYWRKWYKDAIRDKKVLEFKKKHPDTWKRVLELIKL